jgi:hypothetical protein
MKTFTATVTDSVDNKWKESEEKADQWLEGICKVM